MNRCTFAHPGTLNGATASWSALVLQRFSGASRPAQSSRGLEHPKTLPRLAMLSMLFCGAIASSAFSQATFPSPVLTSISPLGGKAGATVEFTLRGTDLDGPAAVLIGDRSISISTTTKASVALPANLPAGAHDLRFVGRYGVSNPRVFVVTPHVVVESPGTNAKPDKALKLAVNSAISGAFKATTPHWFTFEAKKGQSLTATFLGLKADTRAEVLGAISDGKGRELARLKRGRMNFTPPADGTYRMEVHELMHRAGDDYGFFGALEEAKAEEPRIMPSVMRQELKIGDVRRGFFVPSAAWTYDMPFKAGDRFVVEVFSHQLGHDTDPHLVIENLKPDGTITAQAEVADAPAISPAPSVASAIPNRDPSYAYEAKVDGTFRITLNDAFATTQPFELRVSSGAPKTPELIAMNATLPKAANAKTGEVGSANVCRGGILALEVAVLNRNALSEAIELKADKLPAGLISLGGFIGKGQSLGYMAFQATPDAPAGAALVTSLAKSAYVSFDIKDATRDNLLSRRTGPPAIGVSTLSTPALIQTEKNDILEVPADGKLEIPLKVTRHAEFPDAIKLKALGLIDAAKAPEADIPAKAATGKFTLDVKTLKLAPGEYGFILQGPAKMKVRRNLEELGTAEADVKKAVESQAAAKKQLDAANADTTPKKAELVKTATDAVKAADKAKTDADKAVKDLTAKTAAKEATFIVYSNPIRVRVTAVAKK
ncbi:MAG: hypothetical protein IAE77_15985 [Prosthecobacter sp.]|uniref:hypothetical protein n=1 Tax=Prosthecobacter sp. TaxID=1965333 RepID=UPI0019D903D4|nr:hypothetical protein [Prosthecobacter sp.]MBE2284961.1 hypothetical protein [Prosthecobacter sp.]